MLLLCSLICRKSKKFSKTLASINHGKKNITSAIYKDKILGVQFHPEKSQQQGLKLLKDFFLFHA